MSYQVFTIVQGSTQPSLTLNVTNTDGTAFDLTGYTVALDIGFTSPVTKSAEFTDASHGQATFEWLSTDFTVVGRYSAQLYMRSPAGEIWKIGGIYIDVLPSVR